MSRLRSGAVVRDARRVAVEAGVRPLHGVLVQPARLVHALAEPHDRRHARVLRHAAAGHVGQEQPAGVGAQVDDRDLHARLPAALRAASRAVRAARRQQGGAAAVVAPGVGDLRQDGLTEHVARPRERVRHVRVQALDGEQVAHAADARAERRAAVDHGEVVGDAPGRCGGRRSRRRRPPPSARAPARRPAAASTRPRRRRSPDGRRRRPAWGRCSSTGSGRGGRGRRRAGPRPTAGNPKGQRAATALIACGSRPSWPATTAASAPATS